MQQGQGNQIIKGVQQAAPSRGAVAQGVLGQGVPTDSHMEHHGAQQQKVNCPEQFGFQENHPCTQLLLKSIDLKHKTYKNIINNYLKFVNIIIEQ